MALWRYHGPVSEFQSKADTPVGPKENGVHVATPLAASTTVLDLETLFDGVYSRQEYITFLADQLHYYRYSDDPSAVVDAAATTGPTRAFAGPANTPVREIPTGRYLAFRPAANCALRMYVSSKVLG